MPTDTKGQVYARIAPTQFPAKVNGDAPLIHRITAYSKAALWDSVQTWFDGGKEASGLIDPKASAVHTFKDGGGATWEISAPDTPRERKAPLAWSSFATPIVLDETTYGYRWAKQSVSTKGPLVTLPEYYRMEKDAKDNQRWVVVSATDVPPETGLAKMEFAKRPGADRTPTKHRAKSRVAGKSRPGGRPV